MKHAAVCDCPCYYSIIERRSSASEGCCSVCTLLVTHAVKHAAGCDSPCNYT